MGGLLREILVQDCTSLYIINTYLWKWLMRIHSLRVLPWCKTIDSKTIWEQIYASLEDEFSDKTLQFIEKVKFSILASTCCELYHNLQYSKFWKVKEFHSSHLSDPFNKLFPCCRWTIRY